MDINTWCRINQVWNMLRYTKRSFYALMKKTDISKVTSIQEMPALSEWDLRDAKANISVKVMSK